MKRICLVFSSFILLWWLSLPCLAFSSEDRGFVVKFGVMEPANATRDRLRETRKITMDPSRRPGWCFLVDPPNAEPYEIYSIHYLPKEPTSLTGDFKGEQPAQAIAGIKTAVKLVEGIRPFCFDFHRGDPLGEVPIRGVHKRCAEQHPEP